MQTGRPQLAKKYSPEFKGEDQETENICPSSLGAKGQSPVAYSPKTQLFYIPGNNVCMNYEPFLVSYSAGKPYVGAQLDLTTANTDSQQRLACSHNTPRENSLGTLNAWDPIKGEIIWSNPEHFFVWSGALATAGNIIFYGTMEGHLKAIDASTGNELYRFKIPSGIVGNISTWRYQNKQYVGVLSGIGGMAVYGANLCDPEPNGALDTIHNNNNLEQFIRLGGVFSVFTLVKD